MARDICLICGWDARDHPETSRTEHLVAEHEMKPSLFVVRRNFVSPGEVTGDDRANWVEYKMRRIMES